MTTEYLELKLTRRPHSPLFARLAGEYLALGRTGDAKELCRAGLEKYPHYTTGHLIMARCYAAEQDYAAALVSLADARALFPDAPMPRRLFGEWEHFVTPAGPKPQAAQEEVTLPPVEPKRGESSASPETLESPPAIEAREESIAGTTSDRLQEVGAGWKEIGGTLTPGKELTAIAEEPFSDEGRIVSKTLAEIYASQGAYAEAIITYLLLRQQRPGNIAEFDGRILELEKLRIAKLRE